MQLRAILLVIAAVVSAGPVWAGQATKSSGVPARSMAAAHDRAFWRSLVNNGFEVPEGESLDALVTELVGYLGSPDPEFRDAFAYSILSEWIYRQDRLSGARLASLAGRLVSDLHPASVAADGDDVFRRSFSALMLSVVVARDVKAQVLPAASVAAILDAACEYANDETDLRGWVDGKGWAHAAAHTADLLRWLARDAEVGPSDQRRLLGAVNALVTRHHGTILAYGEDGRLAAAVVAVLQRDQLDGEAWNTWVAGLRPALTADPQPSLVRLDAGAYAAQRNTRNLIFSLYVQIELTPELPSSAAAVRQALEAVVLGT